MEKESRLKEFFRLNPKPAICYSGGVDSVYLLYAAVKYGNDACAYFVKTPFQPEHELDDAIRAAKEINAELKIIPLDILSVPEIIANTPDRCYYCKRVIISAVRDMAYKDGRKLLLDGTNASDSYDDRPGMRALSELNVISPLRECGLTKNDIRNLSRKAGLFTYSKPSYSCLATRIQTGENISAALLSKIDGAEKALFSLGFTDFRSRHFNGAAKLEFNSDEIERAFSMRGEIIKLIEPYYKTVLLDLKGR